MTMFSFIIFGNKQQNKPSGYYHVGFYGCKSITEISYESPIGPDPANYKIEFDDAEPIEIDNAILTST